MENKDFYITRHIQNESSLTFNCTNHKDKADVQQFLWSALHPDRIHTDLGTGKRPHTPSQGSLRPCLFHTHHCCSPFTFITHKGMMGINDIFYFNYIYTKKNLISCPNSYKYFNFPAYTVLTSSKLPSNVLYWRSVIERIKSPTRMKSPLVFRQRAATLLKWEHSSLSSRSLVHSKSRTCRKKIIRKKSI